MIDKDYCKDFHLLCDLCMEESAELFGSFDEAVEYKKDKRNGWRSIKDDCGDWQDVCPSCAKENLL